MSPLEAATATSWQDVIVTAILVAGFLVFLWLTSRN